MRATLIIVFTLLASISATRENTAHQQSAKTLSTPSLVLSPCNIEGTPEKVKCGTYEVYENRNSKKGRKISLKVVVFPATGTERAPDPFVYIPGGPGSSATEDSTYVAPQFAKIREHRDLLFVDQRGTGGSHPLNCKFYNAADVQSYFGYFFPLEDVRKCREQLEQQADLTLYTTPIAMDDLDEVRAALGYERLNLFGGSYGTRASLVYLKRHPTHVRTVTLQGVAPTNQYMPLDFAQHMERALQGILAECGADETCNRAFPNLRAETKAVLERLIQGPVEVEVRKNFDRGNDTAGPASTPEERAKVRLSRNLAVEAVRYMLYHPGGASRAPLLLHQAAQGNFTPLAEAALSYRRNLVATGANGMYLSVTCAEDLPWIKSGEGERLAANTFLGDYRLRQQREACALWPRAAIPRDYGEPVRGSAPVLILTGEWDPVTPPSNGDAVARHLPNSLHVIVPHGAHGFGGLEGIECIERLNTEFVQSGAVKGLDTSCVKNIRRKGFSVKL
ncbi:MAG: alpha/beta fold hydrolase [Pyrinomonadaceae bacterium]